MLLGIIGQGFVGNAIYQKFKNYYDVLTFDLQVKLCNSTLEEINDKCNIIFVCLPTPMNKKDGSCYVGIVEETLNELELLASFEQKEKIIVVKSTIPPGTTKNWNKKYKFLNIVFSPEFLTEANAVKDFENQKRIILGGDKKSTTKLKPIFAKAFPKASIIKTDSTYAEMVKYVTNSFLATKVSFANEMYQICQALEVDYDKVVEYACYDERLGKSHWAVPGPDGDFGYGGHCFPKDIKALINLALQYKLDPEMLIATDNKNNNIRSQRDWENMEGRAVI
jgi:UDPglucose 6-dehydrogenase